MQKLLVVISIFVISVIAIFLVLLLDATENSTSVLYKLVNAPIIGTPPADLIAAKAKWFANPIAHYRLRVYHYLSTYPRINCVQDLEVVNEKIVETFEDTCSAISYLQNWPPLGSTVTELFAKFEKETTIPYPKEPDSSGCGIFLTVDVTYSSAGYPTSAIYDWVEFFPCKTHKTIFGENIFDCCWSAADPRQPHITVTLQPLP